MIKSDKDEAITNFKNESDEDLNDFYKSKFKRLAILYKENQMNIVQENTENKKDH